MPCTTLCHLQKMTKRKEYKSLYDQKLEVKRRRRDEKRERTKTELKRTREEKKRGTTYQQGIAIHLIASDDQEQGKSKKPKLNSSSSSSILNTGDNILDSSGFEKNRNTFCRGYTRRGE